MWIERIDFAGFGKFTSEKMEFKPAVLNLVVAPNDYGKSSIADAIWAVLYDFPRPAPGESSSQRQARRPDPATGLPYIASLDVTMDGRSLKVIRDFEDGSMQVVDRSNGNADVTAEFLGPNGEDEIGMRLTGISREMFKNTFFLAQRRLGEHSFAGDSDLSSLFQGIADSGMSDVNAGLALQLLSDAVTRYPYNGTRHKIDEVIGELETKQENLEERLVLLEEQHLSIKEALERLSVLDTKIQGDDQQALGSEYFELCLAAADLDNRIIKAQQRLGRVTDIKEEAERLDYIKDFPIDAEKQLDELWTRRFSRQADYDRVRRDIEPKRAELDAMEKALEQHWHGLVNFSQEEAQSFGVAAINYQNLLNELRDLSRRRQAEIERIRSQSIDIDRIEAVRRSLMSLDSKDFEDARTYEALINSARAQLSECDRTISSSRGTIGDIEDQKKNMKVQFLTGGFKKKELDAATKEIEQRSSLIQELRNTVGNLELRLDGLARKAGLRDGAELLKEIQEYNSNAANIKDLEVLDQVLASREATLEKTRNELKPFFIKAQRGDLELSPENAVQLASDSLRAVEEVRNLNSSSTTVKQVQQELNFLQTEINDIDNLMEAIFIRADLTQPEQIEASYEEFKQRVAIYQRWELLRHDMSMAQTELSYEAGEEDLLLERLEAQRQETWARMQELVNLHPEISEAVPPMPESPPLSGSAARSKLQGMRNEREELVVRVRTMASHHDDHYLPTLQELDTTLRHLKNARRVRMSVELASKTLKRLSQQTYGDWSGKLNDVAREVASGVGHDFEKIEFDSELRMFVKLKGQAPLDPEQITGRLSVGKMELLQLIARMVICKYLSAENALPIILDEPFSEIDDQHFLQVMRFLIDFISADNQIIIFSSHQQRFHWLISQLDPTQIASLVFCDRTPMRS